MRDVEAWLESVQLGEYAPLFAQHQITWDVLPHLTEADIDHLALPLGPRRKLLVQIRALSEGGGATSAPDAEPGHAERRQLTVMFCDLVGSTALTEDLDPEEVRDLMQAYRAACSNVISRYEGYVAQYLGDGMMVYFGWPVAHEDDAERGVRSALEMVRAVTELREARPIAIRIGLATGQVVVGDRVRSDNAEARLAVGGTPNLAARLQALAGTNEIVIGPTTRKLLGGAFGLTDLGTRELKGFAQPTQVWRVDSQRPGSGRFRTVGSDAALTPFVDRADARALLAELWQRARRGAGQLVVVGGQAGIGKSRLVQEFRSTVDGAQAALHYQCSPYHRNSPLHPFIDQLEQAAELAREDTSEKKLERLEQLLADAGPALLQSAPLFAALLSLPIDRYPPLNLSPQMQKQRTLDALVAFLEALTAGGPVLVVIEDLHWIDPTSQELLDLLVPRMAGLSILLLLTHRSEWSPPWRAGPGVTPIHLTALERTHGAQMIDGVTERRSLPLPLLEQILSMTDGVPLFVEEVTKSVLESDLVSDAGDRFTLQRPLGEFTLPASLRDFLMARLDRLGPAKEIAQIGACIGREFTHDLLERVAAARGESLDASIERLLLAGLVTRREEPPVTIYTFKHALLQDAAYDSLLKSRRRELHAKIARVLESELSERVINRPELLAHHLTEAVQLAQAVPLWRKAGMSAVGRVALKEAVAHLQTGLALVEQLPASPERDRLELSLREPLNAAWTGLHGWAAREVGDNALAIHRLAERLGDAQSLLLARWWLWTTTITQGRIAESERWVDHLLGERKASDDVGAAMFGHAASMVQHFLRGELLDSQEEANRAQALYDPRFAERWIELAGHQLGTFVEVYACQLTWMRGFPEQARRESDICLAHARADGHAFGLVWALTFSSYVFAYRREPEQFLDRLDDADRLAKEQGLAFIAEVSVPQARGIIELQRGRPKTAIVHLRQGIDSWTRQGGNVRVPYVKAALAEAEALDGNLDGALAVVEECLAQIEQPWSQERLWLAEVLRIKGWILALMGRNAEAEATLRNSVTCARAQRAKSWELRSATTLARLLAKGGRREEARDLLAPIYAWFTEGLDAKDLVEAKAFLDELSRR
jgi:class 3 adenylate cyclase